MKNYACISLLAFAAVACHKEASMSQVEVLGSQKSKLSPEKAKIVQECKEWFVASTKQTTRKPGLGNPKFF